jgi:hypothetical protein
VRDNGITQWHRRTFGLCRDAEINECVTGTPSESQHNLSI